MKKVDNNSDNLIKLGENSHLSSIEIKQITS